MKKAKLTKLVFNPKWPIVLVGDDKGVVTCLKLSPNLRKQAQPKQGEKVRATAAQEARKRTARVHPTLRVCILPRACASYPAGRPSPSQRRSTPPNTSAARLAAHPAGDNAAAGVRQARSRY